MHPLCPFGNAPRANDANGNTAGSVIGGQTYGFAYDPRQRIALAQANGATVGTYLYNALGQRVYTSASDLRFNYDQAGHVLAHYGASSRDYIWLDDLPVATLDNANSGSVTSSTINYVVADQLATPRAVTNDAGTLVWSWPYQGNPFGEQQPTSSGYTLNLRYPGQWYDSETGTSDNGYRTYESYLGRYAQTDPTGLDGGISTFAYGLNNPLMYTDPLGLCPDEGEQGRYQDCNLTQLPGGGWGTALMNKVRMSLCKKAIDKSCSTGSPYSCCLADFKECSGGAVPGMPPQNPNEAMKFGQCHVKYVKCMATGGAGE